MMLGGGVPVDGRVNLQKIRRDENGIRNLRLIDVLRSFDESMKHGATTLMLMFGKSRYTSLKEQ